LPIEFLHWGNRNFRPMPPVTLTLHRWPSYTNMTRRPWRCTAQARIKSLCRFDDVRTMLLSLAVRKPFSISQWTLNSVKRGVHGTLRWVNNMMSCECDDNEDAYMLLVSRPHFTGSETTSSALVASSTPSRVQAGRPGIQVAAVWNPAVPGGGMPAHRQQRRARRHLRSANANACIVPRSSTWLGDRSVCVAGPRVCNMSTQHSTTD